MRLFVSKELHTNETYIAINQDGELSSKCFREYENEGCKSTGIDGKQFL